MRVPGVQRLPRWSLLAVPVLYLVWHVRIFNFITDDAYISFVYARNLAEHGELTFNLGSYVEGYSNFGWTVLLAALARIGLAPEAVAIPLGIAFAVATLVVSAQLVRRCTGASSLAPAYTAALLAASSCMACWASGGLETQMFSFFVLLAVERYIVADERENQMVAVAVALLFAALTRPEGLLVAAIVGLHRLASAWGRDRAWLLRRSDWLAAAIIVFGLVPYFAWRIWYYGYPFPNTYYIKAAGPAVAGYDEAIWSIGGYYVWRFLVDSRAILALPLIIIGFAAGRGPTRHLATLVATITAAYLLYAASVGGDFMGLYRFVLPLLPLLASAAVSGGVTVVQWIGRPKLLFAIAAAALLLFGASQYRWSVESMTWGNWKSDRGIDTPAFLKVYTDDRATIGRHMRECFTEEDFSIIGGAGAQAYYGHMRGIDVFGLVSRRIAHEVPRTRPRPGHNKWAPDSLLAEYEPSFVFSCYSIHREPNNPRLNCNPSFWLRRGFEKVTLKIPGLLQQGEYYTFLKLQRRELSCPGMVEP